MKFISSRKFLLAAMLILLFSFSLGSWAKNRFQERGDILHDLEIFAKIIEKISTNYVDEVDTRPLVRDAIESMLRELDPHSQYLSGLDYEDLMVSTRGEFGGVGMLISFRDNYPTVISPIEGTPASRAGIVGGDQIVEIEGMSTRNWQVEKAVKYLRGKPGTDVVFKIHRPGMSEPSEYKIKREIIQVKSVPYYDSFGDYGYIKVSNFARQTRDEVQEALRELEKSNIKGLIVDLRSNPGGLLQAATEVSELFLEKDKLVVYTKGRLVNTNQKYYSSNTHVHKGYPIVVMLNGASASASEIFAGALQDWDAGFIIGQTSFGKGTVQTVFSLSDSEAVKLTTAKYYTPSGRSINKDHRKNDEPDVSDLEGMTEMSDASQDDGEVITDGEEPELKVEERPEYTTASGRTVYGGGGITPDLELEPRQYTELQRRLERDAFFFSFGVQYSTDHEVERDFEVTDDVIEKFKAFLTEREFEFKEEEFTEENIDYIRMAILRELTSKKFGRRASYRVILDHDKDLKLVLDLLKDSPTLRDLFTYAEQQRAMKKASLD